MWFLYFRDKREEKNVEDFIIDGIKDQTIVKHAGTVNGEQILIQNCNVSEQNCMISFTLMLLGLLVANIQTF